MPESLQPPQNALFFVANTALLGEFFEAVKSLNEIDTCFKVKAKVAATGNKSETAETTLDPIGVAAYTKRQVIIPAAGRYEFK